MRERECECFRDAERDRLLVTFLFPRAEEDDEDGEDESVDSVSETGELGVDNAGNDDDSDREGNEEDFLIEDRFEVKGESDCFFSQENDEGRGRIVSVTKSQFETTV